MKIENRREAVKGAVVGATLGAPMRGQNQFRKLNYYEPIPTRMVASEALDAWVVGISHLRKRLRPESLGTSIFASWVYTTHESAFGLSNLARGLDAPIAGTFQNPLSDGSQALGRAAFWGLVLADDPEKALEFAYFDASFDHGHVAAACAVAVAAMVASSGAGVPVTAYVKAAKDTLPSDHPAQKAITRIVQGVNEGKDAATVYELIPPLLPTRDPHYAPLNLAYIILGLLYGNGNFGETIKIVAGCGGAADQTTLVAGVILGCSSTIDAEWTDPLGDAWVSGHGLRAIDPPSSISAFTDSVVAVSASGETSVELTIEEGGLSSPLDLPPSGRPVAIPEVEAVSSEVSPTTPDLAEPDPIEAEPIPASVQPSARPPLTISQRLRDRLQRRADLGSIAIGELILTTQYVDPPVVLPGKTNRFVMTFRNEGAEELILDPHLTVPAGWSAAHKMSSFRLRQGEESLFPIVIQAPSGEIAPVTNVRISVSKHEVLVPLLAGQPWYLVGPFVNHDGNGFDKVFRAEDTQKTGEVFNGRSDLPIKWTREWCEGVVFPLEEKFNNGPGVLYLWAKVRLGEPGKYRIVVANPVGAKVWIDKKEVTRYHDIHIPIPRAIQPYVGEFETSGEAEVLIKIMRGKDPMTGPTYIYFLAEDGRHVEPFGFAEMNG